MREFQKALLVLLNYKTHPRKMQGIKTSLKGTFKSSKLSLTEESVLLTKIKEIYLKYLTNTFIFTFHTLVCV